jgi:hypothetical protein
LAAAWLVPVLYSLIGELAYADDVTLMTPIVNVICHMLKACDEFGDAYNLVSKRQQVEMPVFSAKEVIIFHLNNRPYFELLSNIGRLILLSIVF